jgi:hypothetical protein
MIYNFKSGILENGIHASPACKTRRDPPTTALSQPDGKSRYNGFKLVKGLTENSDASC